MGGPIDFLCRPISARSVCHSDRATIAARAGIHNHRQWLWIPGSRASPAPRNDEAEFTRVGISRALATDYQRALKPDSLSSTIGSLFPQLFKPTIGTRGTPAM